MPSALSGSVLGWLGGIVATFLAGILAFARPWARERCYQFLRSDSSKHADYVFDVVADERNRRRFAGAVLDTLADPRYASQHKELMLDRFQDEIQQDVETRAKVDALAFLVQGGMEQANRIEATVGASARAATELTSAVGRLTSMVDRLVESTGKVEHKVDRIGTRVARTEGWVAAQGGHPIPPVEEDGNDS